MIKIIDTPQFQRLRNLKQLGITNYVYPTTTHTRFEHSIGYLYLIKFIKFTDLILTAIPKKNQPFRGLLIRNLIETQPSLKITAVEELCVRIAGLCHDLGHGPFSHLFEEVIDKINPKSSWRHEQMTLKLFDKLIKQSDLTDEFAAYGLFEDEIKLIKDLIYNEDLKNCTEKNYDDTVRISLLFLLHLEFD